MMNRLLLAALFALWSSNSFSEDTEFDASSASSGDIEAPERHHVAVILGYGNKSGSGSGPTGGRNAFVYGIEYQYRLSERFSIGLFYEQATGDFDAEAFGVPVSVSVTERLKLLLAVASERELFKDDEPFFRAGLGYEFEFNEITVSPSAWVDFVNNKQIYFIGLTAGVGFE